MKRTLWTDAGTSRGPRRRGGFTLIELLAVIVILGLLMVFLLPRLTDAVKVNEQQVTEAFLQQVSLAIAEYEGEMGDYPSSSWNDDWGPVPNKLNLGGEALCIALWSEDYGGCDISEDQLVNLDRDRAKKSLTTHGNADLFELKDAWGNPIAYFHRRDYDRDDLYLTIDGGTGEVVESKVEARVNPRTGNPYNSRKFQLLSAGIDGVFGTGDDVANFQIERE